jgi:hypothetical protein
MELYRRSRREHAPPKTTPSRLSAGRLSDKCSEQEKQMYSSTKSCNFSQNPITNTRKRDPLSSLELAYHPGDTQLYHQDAHAPPPFSAVYADGTAAHGGSCYASAVVTDPDENDKRSSGTQETGNAGLNQTKYTERYASVFDSDSDDEGEQNCQGEYEGGEGERAGKEDEEDVRATQIVGLYLRQPIRRPRRQSLLSKSLNTRRSIMTASGKGTSVSSRTTIPSVGSLMPSSAPSSGTSVASSVTGSVTVPKAIGKAAHAGREDTSYAELSGGQAW